MRKQLTHHKEKIYICDRCLHYFSSENLLQDHKPLCIKLNTCRIELPKDYENTIRFKNLKYKERVPIVIYGDTECLLKTISEEPLLQEHKAFSIGFYLKNSFDDTKSYYKSYRQTEEAQQSPAEWFVTELKKIAEEYEIVYKNPKPIILTPADLNDFKNASTCWICGKNFTKKEKRIHEHDHFSGKYRGAAHNKCNLNYRKSRYIPVIFHNLSGYDAHLIIREIHSNKILSLIHI